MVVITGAEFNRAPSAVKRRVLETDEPVIVTEHARPAMVVMRYADYSALAGHPAVTDLAEWLQMDEVADFDPEPIGLGLQAVDL